MPNPIPALLTREANIFAALGLESLPPERKAAMVEKMAALVEKRFLLKVMDSLTDADLEQVSKLADKPDDMWGYIASKKNLDAMLLEEINAVKSELLVQSASLPKADEI
ncbi:hypothetical protein HY633_05025 [Candidatus Uhrbacteria bacterium]|nr:hypothetical protein [Candidatus Uhrbacteria bacterium]